MSSTIGNYPIKYAVQPVYRNISEGRVQLGYIVSKVYVVREIIDYSGSDIKRQYTVVFPVKAYNPTQEIISTRTPDVNAYGYQRYTDVVREVYDDFEKAKEQADKANCEFLTAYFPEDKRMEILSRLQDWEFKVSTATATLGIVSKVK